MIVPVIWAAATDSHMARGYWDEGLLEALFARELWTPPCALTFEHYEVHGDFPEVEGAVVILPARHHVNHVSWFKDQLDTLAWSVVVLAGDEEWDFPWREIEETPTRKLWIMQPRPEHENVSGLIPGGWYPGTHQGVKAQGYLFDEPAPRDKEMDWFFAGQVTHVRREQCADALHPLRDADPDSCWLLETEGYTQGMKQETYWVMLADAKIIPCPSGPEHVDTARAFEALEAGSVPVCDLVKPHTRHSGQFNYWKLLFGERMPLPTIENWDEFPRILERELSLWPANSNRCFSMWQQWKRKIVKQMDSDVRQVYMESQGDGDMLEDAGPNDLITVVVTTSPSYLHPSTEHIRETVDTVRHHLPLAEILVVCDGPHPDEDQARIDDYEEYQRRLFWLCNFEYDNVVPIRIEKWGHQANATRVAMGYVDTPLVLFVEHDTPLKENIDFDGICSMVMSGEANAVRFHHEAEVLPDHTHLFLDEVIDPDVFYRHGVPLIRTVAWWQRPHVARADFYRDTVLPMFSPESRCFIEDVLYGKVQNDYLDRGEPAWWDWRIWVYAPEGSMQRSWHLDSRGDEAKREQTF